MPFARTLGSPKKVSCLQGFSSNDDTSSLAKEIYLAPDCQGQAPNRDADFLDKTLRGRSSLRHNRWNCKAISQIISWSMLKGSSQTHREEAIHTLATPFASCEIESNLKRDRNKSFYLVSRSSKHATALWAESFESCLKASFIILLPFPPCRRKNSRKLGALYFPVAKRCISGIPCCSCQGRAFLS